MGLDMYLTARQYISGYQFSAKDESTLYGELVDKFGMLEYVDPDSPAAYVMFTVAYWRKVNAVHDWFVRNVQDGKDECLPHYVPLEKLKELRHLCSDLLRIRAEEGEARAIEAARDRMEPKEGFFFGTYEYDEWYWEGLRDTVKQIDRVLAIPGVDRTWSLEYRSSW